MKKINCLISLIFSTIFISCSSLNLNELSDSPPKFILEEYFNGKINAWGVVLDRSGMPIKQFTVALTGTNIEDNKLSLFEEFNYSDGKKETRTWTIKKVADNNYEGTAPDVVGKAIGESKGSALNWHYALKIPVDDEIYEVNFDDWMFLQSDTKTLINKAVMSKFGIYLGEVLIFFRKD